MTELFRIPVNIQYNNFKISYDDPIMLFGSCFSDNIGYKLDHYKFKVNINPFGLLYNPKSIYNNISALLDNTEPKEADLIEHNSLWHSWDFHGSFSAEKKTDALSVMQSQFTNASKELKNIKVLIITFGTSWIYRYSESNKTVANCHKVSSEKFERYRLSTKEIIKDYEELINKIKKINPELIIIFTVSPVRHLKDGAHDNQLSKSSLLLAIDSLTRSFNNCYYFPSYEIMMDELRDYRFYKNDMIHPSYLAVDYIWDKFRLSFISNHCYDLMNQVKKLRDALSHKPLKENSEKHKKFKKKFLEFSINLSNQNPFLNLKEEIDFFNY